jgi:hypothetical protein
MTGLVQPKLPLSSSSSSSSTDQTPDPRPHSKSTESERGRSIHGAITARTDYIAQPKLPRPGLAGIPTWRARESSDKPPLIRAIRSRLGVIWVKRRSLHGKFSAVRWMQLIAEQYSVRDTVSMTFTL